MITKVNVLHIVKGHVSTLSDARTEKILIKDIIFFYFLPFIFLFINVYCKFILPQSALNSIISACATFIALMLTSMVIIFDKGSKLESTSEKYKEEKLSLLKDMFFNIGYVILVALLLIILSIIISIIGHENLIRNVVNNSYFNINIRFDCINVGLSGVIIYFGINMLFTILMIIKRLHNLLIPEI